MSAETSGIIYIHTVPKPVCAYIQSIIRNLLQEKISFNWQKQDLLENMYKCQIEWTGDVGLGAKIASAFRGWEHLRYEVTENPSLENEGGRWMHTPSLGIFYQVMDLSGNFLIPEERIKVILETGGNISEIRRKLDLALGTAWDSELEPFRMSNDQNMGKLKWIGK
jgi:hypothetical protein